MESQRNERETREGSPEMQGERSASYKGVVINGVEGNRDHDRKEHQGKGKGKITSLGRLTMVIGKGSLVLEEGTGREVPGTISGTRREAREQNWTPPEQMRLRKQKEHKRFLKRKVER
ncbi:hypothetical protein DY000_02020454 [Brassica cretica]|uniref:Uncharacterized protein n=1 Tax=Brassica cretica TaxID=69181 RepID=A0ABQ7E4S8_BRACR|nr:hypothetical protein DY000_02020454 [Brassica cretica]